MKRVLGVLIGTGLVVLAIGAFFSNEAASKTSSGRIAILFAAVMGSVMVINNLVGSSGKANSPAPAPVPQAAPPCPRCGKPLSPEYSHCPYCGSKLKGTCPACKQEVKEEFRHCPYCATPLKNLEPASSDK